MTDYADFDQPTNRSAGLRADLADGFNDLLCRVADRAPEDLHKVVAENTRWTVSAADHRRPFVPAVDRLDRATTVLVPLLLPWVAQYVTNYPVETGEQVCAAMAAEAVSALQGAHLVIPDGIVESPARRELLRVVEIANSKTEKRDGTMGGGYYGAYVSSGEIVDAILASGWTPALAETSN